MKKVLAILFILFLPFTYLAQESGKWTKITSPSGDLSVLLPAGFLINNEEGKYRAYAYVDEVIIRIEFTDSEEAKARLIRRRQNPGETEAKITQITRDDFIGDIYNYSDEKSFSIDLASSKGFYTIYAFCKDKNVPEYENFLYSIRLAGQPLFKQQTSAKQDISEGITLSSLKTSPIILEALQKKDAEKSEIKYDIGGKEANDKTDLTKYSRPWIMLRAKMAAYTEKAKRKRIEGEIILNVVFKADGQVGDISVLQKLEGGLLEEAIKQAQKIKFVPAEIDGKPVDVTRTVRYHFRLRFVIKVIK